MPFSHDSTFDVPFQNHPVRLRQSEDFYHHILDEHLLNKDEPFGDYLPATVMTLLPRSSKITQAEREALYSELATFFKGQIKDALQRPMLMAYTQLDVNDNYDYDGWLVQTRAGFVVPLRKIGDIWQPITAFFYQRACEEDHPNKRWQISAKCIVREKYGYMTRDGYVAATQVPAFRDGKFVGHRVDITFIFPENWGFVDGVYTGRPKPWPKPKDE